MIWIRLHLQTEKCEGKFQRRSDKKDENKKKEKEILIKFRLQEMGYCLEIQD